MKRLHLNAAALLAVAVLFVAPAMAIDVPPPAPQMPNAVSIGWMVYVPTTLTVKAGTSIIWTNVNDSSHDVQFPDQKSSC